MTHQTMEMAEASQVIHESAVDQKADEGQEQPLGKRRGPPGHPCGLQNCAGYSADCEEGSKDGDDDGGPSDDDFSTGVHGSVMHGRAQTVPFGTIWLRSHGTPTEARTTAPAAPALFGVVELRLAPVAHDVVD